MSGSRPRSTPRLLPRPASLGVHDGHEHARGKGCRRAGEQACAALFAGRYVASRSRAHSAPARCPGSNENEYGNQEQQRRIGVGPAASARRGRARVGRGDIGETKCQRGGASVRVRQHDVGGTRISRPGRRRQVVRARDLNVHDRYATDRQGRAGHEIHSGDGHGRSAVPRQLVPPGRLVPEWAVARQQPLVKPDRRRGSPPARRWPARWP